MKKIMFNDKCGLTDAVLQGRKTMTRRIIRNLSDFDPRINWFLWGSDNKGKENIGIFRYETYKYSIYPQYQPGEVVAVAQAYNKFVNDLIGFFANTKAWSNKLFVRPDLMPHRIRITDIKVERLQDISDEDCREEGINQVDMGFSYRCPHGVCAFSHPKEAFASLIDTISGKGTWESNPWVFAYTFELLSNETKNNQNCKKNDSK